MISIAAISALLFTSLASAQPANPDVTLCRLGDTQIRAEFHSETGALNIELTKPGRVQSYVGQSHQYASPGEIKSDAMLAGLVQISALSMAAIQYASVSVISQLPDGVFVVVKFVGANESVLATAGVNGMSPFRCQP